MGGRSPTAYKKVRFRTLFSTIDDGESSAVGALVTVAPENGDDRPAVSGIGGS
ncbi:hypothetical protein [Natronococcus jeotgali]|uniref:hypothetical protein n=1 Tax=Natronococcus jeotgali TaxID=413812 RepID=UPI001360B2AE|nr:hypothetical protein [Natronococcus jeotgali]